jgi:hypothetical protein
MVAAGGLTLQMIIIIIYCIGALRLAETFSKKDVNEAN